MILRRALPRIVLAYALLSISIQTLANVLSVHDIVYNREALSPQQLAQLQWIPDSHDFSYVTSSQSLVLARAAGTIFKILELKALNELSKTQATKFPIISWVNNSNFWFQDNDRILIYNVADDSVRTTNILMENAENIALFSPDKVAYTVGPNLFLSIERKIKQLTNFRDDECIVSGHSVHRQEFGINKGIFWSPKGNFIAYYRMNESMVEDYPLEDFIKIPVKIEYIKYPMAGRKSHQVTLIIYDLTSEKEIALETGEPLDQYLTNVTWHSEEKYILVNVLNREQNHLKTIKYNATTGKQEDVVFEFVADKYINSTFGFYFSNTTPNQPLWCSRHNGWYQLYELDIVKRSINLATPIQQDISECYGFKSTKEHFFFTAFDKDYPAQHGYSYNLSTKKVVNLTNDIEGMHTIIPSNDGQFVFDIYSNSTTPYQVDIIDSHTRNRSKVYKAEDPMRHYDIGTINLISVKSVDEKYDLFYRMILPPNFDETKKYPVIFYVYGGPGVQIVQDTWLFGARLWEVMMSQKGYIVFAIDNRGSANRGLTFEQETYCRLGSCELNDQIQAVNFLRELKFVDTQRMGVFGWSFGGFMATSLMLKAPGIFKAGVAGGAVIDWESYEVMYTERYMKKPQENPEGYAHSNLLNFVKDLKGDLLLISGTHDDTVLPRHTKLFISKAIEEGKKLDTFFYPYEKHHFDIPSDFHMYDKITNYFDERLQ